MRFKNADDLRRHALSRGVEAVIDGKTFNAAGKVSTLAPRPAATPAPTPEPVETPAQEAAEPEIDRDDVEAIVNARVLEAQTAFMDAMQKQQTATLAAIAQLASTTRSGREVLRHELDISSNKYGAIERMTITPIYKE